MSRPSDEIAFFAWSMSKPPINYVETLPVLMRVQNIMIVIHRIATRYGHP